jgi:hypothetical protein
MNYLNVIKTAALSRAKMFGVLSRALYEVSAQELYAPYDSVEKWLVGNDIDISRPTFYRMKSLGLLLKYVEVSDTDLALVGEASMYQLARLGSDHETATKFWESGDIPNLINGRIDRSIATVAELKIKVDALLGKEPKEPKEKDGEGESEGEGEGEDAGSEWKDKYNALIKRMKKLAPQYEADRFVSEVLRVVS